MIVLNKADLVDDPEEIRFSLEAGAPGVEIFAVSCANGEGIADVRNSVSAGETVELNVELERK